MGRKRTIAATEPYHSNPDISIIDFYIDGELVVAGTDLKIKNDRGIYRFLRFCYNSKLDKEWVDLRSPNGNWCSVRPSRIKGLAQRKRSIAKKKK